MKRQTMIFSIGLILSLFINLPLALGASPQTPTGLCINASPCASTSTSTGVMPGTQVKIFPGFIIGSSENESVSVLDNKWKKLYSGDRSQRYRPKGVYGGITRRLDWKRFYRDQTVRPANPNNPNDPAYDWSLLDAIFEIDAVQNDGALVYLDIGDFSFNWKGTKAPKWLYNAPYNGVFQAGADGSTGQPRAVPKYYRYQGPDILGRENVGNGIPIVEEFVMFHNAMHQHLKNKGYIDKVMGVVMSELFLGDPAYRPADFNVTDFHHGTSLRQKGIADIWAQSQIATYANSLLDGNRKDVAWQYITPSTGLAFPDVKLNNTNPESGLSGVSRFDDVDGQSQEDVRPLLQATEGNGWRANTYFTDTPNPWGYKNQWMKQTPSHILWVLSGCPKSANKDSNLGQKGDDPCGFWPVHNVVFDWDKNFDLSPTLADWHEAIDRFGPPGTFAFPYLPKGYQP